MGTKPALPMWRKKDNYTLLDHRSPYEAKQQLMHGDVFMARKKIRGEQSVLICEMQMMDPKLNVM